MFPRIFGFLLISLASVSFLSSCIFEYPPECEFEDGQENQVILHISMDSIFNDYKFIDGLNLNTRSDSTWIRKYWIAIYNEGDKEPFMVLPSLSTEVSLNLYANNYTFAVWSETLPDPNDKTYFFHVDDFSEMLLKHKYDYKGNDPEKTPHRGVLTTTITSNTKDLYIDLKPIYAKYKLVATDEPEFKPGRIKITYTTIPSSIHAVTGEINVLWGDVSFNSFPNGKTLGFDHVISLDEEETSVSIKVEIYDQEDRLKARVQNLTIPLINRGITTVTGNFYSMLVPDEDIDSDNDLGGVIIDPNWESTIYIEY